LVARLLEEGIEDCLACLIFLFAQRPRMRTTNGMEWLHEAITRRARVGHIVPNAEACLRRVRAVCVEHSEE
jgi:transposase-like protein